MQSARHQHAGGGVAGLACVAEAAFHALADCSFQIGVFQDDVGGLAAQFLGHALDGVRSGFGHDDAGAGGTGKRHHVHIFVSGHDLSN